jgi:hypothetical protein
MCYTLYRLCIVSKLKSFCRVSRCPFFKIQVKMNATKKFFSIQFSGQMLEMYITKTTQLLLGLPPSSTLLSVPCKALPTASISACSSIIATTLQCPQTTLAFWETLISTAQSTMLIRPVQKSTFLRVRFC